MSLVPKEHTAQGPCNVIGSYLQLQPLVCPYQLRINS